jgi:hypothetical protein
MERQYCMERQGGRGWVVVVDICGTPPILKKLKSKEDKWKLN